MMVVEPGGLLLFLNVISYCVGFGLYTLGFF